MPMAFAAVGVAFGAAAGTTAAIMAGVAIVGAGLSVLGAITGNETLSMVGSVMGIVGGVGGMMASASAAATAAAAGTEATNVGAMLAEQNAGFTAAEIADVGGATAANVNSGIITQGAANAADINALGANADQGTTVLRDTLSQGQTIGQDVTSGLTQTEFGVTGAPTQPLIDSPMANPLGEAGKFNPLDSTFKSLEAPGMDFGAPPTTNVGPVGSQPPVTPGVDKPFSLGDFIKENKEIVSMLGDGAKAMFPSADMRAKIKYQKGLDDRKNKNANNLTGLTIPGVSRPGMINRQAA